MPKNPVEFAFGDYEDAAPQVEDRRVLNCYPETTPGKNARTIVRGIEGFSELGSVTGVFLGATEFGADRYFSVTDGGGGGNLHKVDSIGNITLIGNMPNLSVTKSVKMVQNGKNIIINSDGPNASNDYYYDPGTTTLDQIVNFSATYSGFQRAKDVVFKDGYYVFSTIGTIFHGDNVTVGSGITFNALSFQNIPAESGSGGGMEVANSLLYVFTSSKTYMYSVSSTTPFSFQINKSLTLDIGSSFRTQHQAMGNTIYAFGSQDAAQTVGLYKIAGSTISLLREQELDDIFTGQFYFWSYQLNSHKFIGYTNTDDVLGRERSYCYDDTESLLRGYPIWHRRSFVSTADKEVITEQYPIAYYSATAPSGGVRQIITFAYNEDDGSSYIYELLENSSLNTAAGLSIPTGSSRTFEYSFPVLRNSSEPLIIKSIGFGFNENISTAELLRSVNGVDFVSLGEFDITTVSSNRCEWRRIGRFETDVNFKLRLDVVDITKPMVVLDGYIET